MDLDLRLDVPRERTRDGIRRERVGPRSVLGRAPVVADLDRELAGEARDLGAVRGEPLTFRRTMSGGALAQLARVAQEPARETELSVRRRVARVEEVDVRRRGGLLVDVDVQVAELVESSALVLALAEAVGGVRERLQERTPQRSVVGPRRRRRQRLQAPARDLRTAVGVGAVPQTLREVVDDGEQLFVGAGLSQVEGASVRGRAALGVALVREHGLREVERVAVHVEDDGRAADLAGRDHGALRRDDQIARVEYEMSPAERLRAATGIDLADDAQHESGEQNTGRGVNRIANPASYSLAQLAWSFMGSTATIHRARVQRDVHYQPGHFGATDADTGKPHPRAGKPSLATHPTTTLKLTGEQYFMCGDNSPASADGRLWAAPHPWIADQVDPTPGVVNKELLVGKAFVVYFPAPHPTRFIPLPDAGRVRFIW